MRWGPKNGLKFARILSMSTSNELEPGPKSFTEKHVLPSFHGLSNLMGVKAYDAQGNYVGRVREFFIEPAEAPNRISHFLLSRGRFQPLVAKHNQIASVSDKKIQLNVGEKALEIYQPNESWLAVQKDLLD